MAKLPQLGGCACGAQRYEMRAAPIMLYSCHCKNCQKISGGPFATSATISEASLVFTKGTPAKVKWTSDAGNMRWGWYCGACGSRIANGTASNAWLSLRVGTLDDTSWVDPVGDTWLRSKQPWVHIPEGRLTAQKQPADYAPFIARFRAQGHFPE